MDVSLSKLQEIVKGMMQSMGSQSIGHSLVTEQQQIVVGEKETELNPTHKKKRKEKKRKLAGEFQGLEWTGGQIRTLAWGQSR